MHNGIRITSDMKLALSEATVVHRIFFLNLNPKFP